MECTGPSLVGVPDMLKVDRARGALPELGPALDARGESCVERAGRHASVSRYGAGWEVYGERAGRAARRDVRAPRSTLGRTRSAPPRTRPVASRHGCVHSDGVVVLGHEIHFENPDDAQCCLHCAYDWVTRIWNSSTRGSSSNFSIAWLGTPVNGKSGQNRRSGDERETTTHDVERHGPAAPGT